MSYASSSSSWKLWIWMRLDLIFTMRDINISCNLELLKKFSSSSRSANFKDILPWNISQKITKTVPISTRIFINCTMKIGIPFLNWREVNGTRGNIIRISLCLENYYRTNTRVRTKKQIQRSRIMRITARDPSSKVNLLSNVVWDITGFTRSINSTRIG